MTCKPSDVRRQSDRSSWKMESVDGRMEDNARKMGRGHPPLDRDKTPGPWGLGGEIQIDLFWNKYKLTLFLQADLLYIVEDMTCLLHKAFWTLQQVSFCWIVGKNKCWVCFTTNSKRFNFCLSIRKSNYHITKSETDTTNATFSLQTFSLSIQVC